MIAGYACAGHFVSLLQMGMTFSEADTEVKELNSESLLEGGKQKKKVTTKGKAPEGKIGEIRMWFTGLSHSCVFHLFSVCLHEIEGKAEVGGRMVGLGNASS